MTTNTVISALSGGVFIGVAATLLLWLNGRIAGVSGIIGNLLFTRERLWPALFIAGIAAGAASFYALGGSSPAPRASFPAWLLAISGLRP